MSKERFEVLMADTHESLRLHYVVRYRVFCVETRYENPSDFPDKMERDRFDNHSVHFLVRARESGQWVAAMRLVTGLFSDLPLVERCAFESENHIPRTGELAEVSRLCVVGSLRRRKQEHASPHVIPWDKKDREPQEAGLIRVERRREPEILLRLISAAVEYGRERQMRYYYALMAEPLMRILRRIGLRITPIGPACEYRGARWPCLIDLDNLFLDIPRQNSSMREIFQTAPAYRRYSEWKGLVIPEAPVYREIMQK